MPNAPRLSLLSWLKLPVIVVGPQKRSQWGKIVWRRQIGNVVIKKQQKFLFPSAPRLSPFHYLSRNTIRFQTVADEKKARRHFERTHRGEEFSKDSRKRRTQSRKSSKARQEKSEEQRKSHKQNSQGHQHSH